MITPFPPPAGPRVELLRIRRDGPGSPIQHPRLLLTPSDPPLAHNPEEEQPHMSDQTLQETSSGDNP